MRLCHRHSPVLEHAHHSTDSLALIGSQAHPPSPRFVYSLPTVACLGKFMSVACYGMSFSVSLCFVSHVSEACP